jgi:maleate cis-trans isomerase
MFGFRKRIGYIAPTVMEVVPYEFYRFAPDGIGLVGVTCNIDDWSQPHFDRALTQVTEAAAYLGSRGVDFVVHGGGPLVVARGKGYEDVIVNDIERTARCRRPPACAPGWKLCAPSARGASRSPRPIRNGTTSP